MKSTVPVGTGERVRARLDARGLAHVGYVSNPEFLAEGTALANFMEPDRVVVGGFAEADADRVAALYEPLDAPDRAHRRRLRGDDQARLERGAHDADQLHQRDRERLRARRGRRRGGRPRGRPRPAPRAALPARGHRLRRLVLPEGRLGAQAARRQLGLPLPAPHGRDRGQRAPEAARRPEAPEPPRLAAREDRGAARARVQAAHERHARGAEPRPRPAAARGGRRGARLGSGRARRGARGCSEA